LIVIFKAVVIRNTEGPDNIPMDKIEKRRSNVKVLVLIALCGFGWIVVTEIDAALNTAKPLPESGRLEQFEQSDECALMNFRFLKINDTVQSSNFRQIEVFMDIRDFSEENLRRMFLFLSKSRPEPQYLTVLVKTDWNQFEYPSDCPPVARSKVPPNVANEKLLEATFFRRGDNVFFRYGSSEKGLTTVVLKGQPYP